MCLRCEIRYMKMGKEIYGLLLAYLREDISEKEMIRLQVVGRKRAAPKVDGGASG